MGMDRNVIGRNPLEEELIKGEARFRTLFEQSNLAIQIVAQDGHTLMVNRTWEELWGVPFEALSNYNILQDRELIKQGVIPLIQKALAGEAVVIPEFEYDKSSVPEVPGQSGKVWVRTFVYPLIADDNMVREIVLVQEDVSHLIKTEERLRRSEEGLAEAQRIARIGSWEWYVETNEAYWSDETYRLFGLTRSKLDRHRENFLHFILPEDRPRVDKALSDAISGTREYNLDYRIKLADGTEKDIHAQAEVIRNNVGQPMLMRGTVQDITERKNMEAELFQAHKMEAIGTLAGGIAHDFNNILAAIIGYTDMAMDDIPEWSPSKNYLDQVLKAGNRAKELVSQILTFSRKGPEIQKPLQLSVIIKEGLKLIRASMPATIEIRDEIDSDCGSILANPTNIHQVLVNLCTNALHAMAEEKGMLTVKLTRVEIGENEAALQPGICAGAFIELQVSDTGCGMDERTMQRIFEPYFTTKDVGKGSGMGLALVHSIAQGCGGFIAVESELGKGSTFRVYFPAIEESEISEKGKMLESFPTGNERILVVDDEEAIVGMYKASLRSSVTRSPFTPQAAML